MILCNTGLTVKKLLKMKFVLVIQNQPIRTLDLEVIHQRSTYVLILAFKMSSLSKFYVSSTECSVLIG